jgi:prolyl-tRNA editing enzyme YbaK/EbsC (Cys-tRNA(Pro) deacylase)
MVKVLCPAGDHEHSLLVDPADIVRVTRAHTVDLRMTSATRCFGAILSV